MGFYDFLDEEVLKSEIAERIKALKNAIDKYKEKERLLEEDLEHVSYEVSRELLREESDQMVRWIQSYQREIARLNELLARNNEGFKISRYELGI